jgi:hypothetical protein
MSMLNTRLRVGAFAAALLLSIGAVGCDQGGGPNGTDGPGPGNGGEVVDLVIVDQDTEPQFYELRGGRYRVSWNHRCPAFGVHLVNADGTEVYSRTSRTPVFSAIVSDVPAGTYEYTQTEAECETYTLRLDRLGN